MSGDPPSAEEIVEVLAVRDGVLAALDSGPRDVRDLRDDLGCSRSTAYKAVRELQTEELVEGADGEYRLTLLGRLLATRYRRFLATIDEIAGHGDVFRALPSDLPLHPSTFADAEIVASGAVAPDRPVEALVSFIAEARSFRAFTSVTRSRYRKFGERLLDRGDVTFEMIHRREWLEYARANHPDQLRRFVESDDTTYYLTEAEFPFGLVLVDAPDRRVGITLYDGGHLQAFVAADGAEAYRWADDLYESYRRDAARLTVEALDERGDA